MQRPKRPKRNPSPLWMILVLTLLTLPLVVTAQPPAGPPGERIGRAGHGPGGPGATGESLFRHLGFLADFLELTDEQIEEARLLAEDLKAALQPLREQARATRREVRAALGEDNPDPTRVGTLVIDQHRLRQEMKALVTAAVEDFRALLTSEQQELLDRFRESRRGRRGQRGGPGGGPGGGGGAG